jgi:hypothetical protein
MDAEMDGDNVELELNEGDEVWLAVSEMETDALDVREADTDGLDVADDAAPVVLDGLPERDGE